MRVRSINKYTTLTLNLVAGPIHNILEPRKSKLVGKASFYFSRNAIKGFKNTTDWYQESLLFASLKMGKHRFENLHLRSKTFELKGLQQDLLGLAAINRLIEKFP